MLSKSLSILTKPLFMLTKPLCVLTKPLSILKQTSLPANQTSLYANQTATPAPGKLVRFLVGDGEHVSGGQAFCEMEVMKMYMQLTTAHSGAQFTCFTGTKVQILTPSELL
jgi:acetyl/propionyl-CoA carboxylase alpha subunit